MKTKFSPVLSFWVVCICTKCYSMCPPLIAPKGTYLLCEDPVYSQPLDCTASWLPQGTVGKFRCVREGKKVLKGRILCFDDGVHKPLEGLNTAKTEKSSLPCNIREDKEKSEMHLYGFESPTNYPLMENSNDFHVIGLSLHNYFRQLHGARPLQLWGNLSSLAQTWAEKVAETGRLNMSPDTNTNSLGQNIFLARTENISVAVSYAIKNWYYHGLEEYRWDDVTENWDSSSALQFSQLLWQGSKYLGIGAAKMKNSQENVNNKVVIVAFYDPSGNVVFDGNEDMSENSFKINVKPKIEKHPPV